MIPFTNDIKRIHNLTGDSSAWYQLDGGKKFRYDALMTHKCYNILKIIALLWEAFRDITQPCDCGNIFKSSKKVIKNISDSTIDENPFKIEVLSKLLREKSLASLDARKRKLAIYGLIRVQQTCHSNKPSSLDSFNWTFDMLKILRSFSSLLTKKKKIKFFQ